MTNTLTPAPGFSEFPSTVRPADHDERWRAAPQDAAGDDDNGLADEDADEDDDDDFEDEEDEEDETDEAEDADEPAS